MANDAPVLDPFVSRGKNANVLKVVVSRLYLLCSLHNILVRRVPRKYKAFPMCVHLEESKVIWSGGRLDEEITTSRGSRRVG